MKIEINEIKVEIKLSDKTGLKATAIINFGEITIKGFRLSVSEHKNENLENEHLYLQVPSIRVGSSHLKIVFINDKEKWKAVERKVYEEYREVIRKTQTNEEEIWPI